MKDAMRILRPALLVAALFCLIIGAAIATDWITVSYGMRVPLACAWGFWGIACYVGSKIAGELAA